MENYLIKKISPSCKDLGLHDDYEDGRVAKLWELFIGDEDRRSSCYRREVTTMLKEKKCKNILDVACGTGTDSIMLLEEGFNVTSIDASPQMLKYAFKERWNRRKEALFDKWVIEEANWLTLPDDIKIPDNGYDAVICLGNSISDILDDDDRQLNFRKAVSNFKSMLKPGGYLLIDHLNYEKLWDQEHHHAENIYFNCNQYFQDVKTSAVMIDGKFNRVMRDYKVDLTDLTNRFHRTDSTITKRGRYDGPNEYYFHFIMSHHTKEDFTSHLRDIFGNDSNITILGDFKSLQDFEGDDRPIFYIYLVQK